MHIVSNKLVGGYVSEIAAEGGSTIIVIEDSDTTASRKFQNYRYVQSKGLTELGAAVHPYGVVIIPDSVKERATAGEINLTKYHVEVNFNREVYAITLSALLALEIGDGIEFVKTGLGYADGAVSAGIPPFYASLADKYLKINHTATGLEWADIPEELPEIESGDAGKVLTVNANEDGVEWTEIPEELPDTTGASAGDVLTIGSDGLEWAEVPDELPTIASGDAGKVLAVNAGETGTEWVAPSGGGSNYVHNINLYGSSFDINFSFINNVSTPYIVSGQVIEALKAKNPDFKIPVTGYYDGPNKIILTKGSKNPSYDELQIWGVSYTYADGVLTFNTNVFGTNIGSNASCSDRVMAI